jgi:hypothetical protein
LAQRDVFHKTSVEKRDEAISRGRGSHDTLVG